MGKLMCLICRTALHNENKAHHSMNLLRNPNYITPPDSGSLYNVLIFNIRKVLAYNRPRHRGRALWFHSSKEALKWESRWNKHYKETPGPVTINIKDESENAVFRNDSLSRSRATYDSIFPVATCRCHNNASLRQNDNARKWCII